jgi:hypothetical protein
MARSYLTWGKALAEPRPGCIAVLKRGLDPRSGHVGFFVTGSESTIYPLGGNQGHGVRIAAFPVARLLGYRWPSTTSSQSRPTPSSTLYDFALAHVLCMEGGRTKDPHDPGGATNFGITIGEYAEWKGLRANDIDWRALELELRHIGQETCAASTWKTIG